MVTPAFVCYQASLENELESPDASTILHHLFPPLALLVDESFELYGDEIVCDVVVPRLTHQAVDLLGRELDTRERDVWMALGTKWTEPRSVSNSFNGTCVPLTGYLPLCLLLQPRHVALSPGVPRWLVTWEHQNGGIEEFRTRTERKKPTGFIVPCCKSTNARIPNGIHPDFNISVRHIFVRLAKIIDENTMKIPIKVIGIADTLLFPITGRLYSQ